MTASRWSAALAAKSPSTGTSTPRSFWVAEVLGWTVIHLVYFGGFIERAAEEGATAFSIVVGFSINLRTWEDRLPPSFRRVHRSVLVNLEHVEEFERDENCWVVHVRGHSEPLPVSRRFVRTLKMQLQSSP